MVSHRQFARSCHRNSCLTHCWDPGCGTSQCQDEGAAVAAPRVERGILETCHSLITTKLPFAFCKWPFRFIDMCRKSTPNVCTNFKVWPCWLDGNQYLAIFHSSSIHHACFLNSSSCTAEVGHVEIDLTILIHFLLVNLILLCLQ